MLTLALLGLAFCPAADHPGAIRDAAADLLDPKAVPPFLREYARYLDFSDYPEADRPMAVAVLKGHVNALSRNARIIAPVMVTPTLMRLYFRDYQWKREVWESLKDSDPYFHTVVVRNAGYESPWPGGIWPEDGRYYAPGAFVTVTTKKSRKIVSAVQTLTPAEAVAVAAGKLKLAETSIGKLIEGTQSEAPIVDAIWFFQQTAADFGRKPGYHDFLGYDSKKEFDAVVGFKEQDSREFSDLWAAAVARSGVLAGRNPRRIEVYDKVGGKYWITKDSSRAVDRKNPLRVIDDNLDFDAQEAISNLPNGMMATGLFNSKGVRQDNAPDAVVGWKGGANNDTKLHNYISCVACHENAGIKDFDEWFRRTFAPPRAWRVPTMTNSLKLSRRYLTQLSPGVRVTRTAYAEAVWEATGLKPSEWSEQNLALWKYYLGAEVDLAWAARSLGTTPQGLQTRLAEIKRTTGQIDPVLQTFLEPPGPTIDITAWEEAFPLAQAYLRGVSSVKSAVVLSVLGAILAPSVVLGQCYSPRTYYPPPTVYSPPVYQKE